MADMTVVCLWLPDGNVDVDAGLAEVERLGDHGLIEALPFGTSSTAESPEQYIEGWEFDLMDDLGESYAGVEVEGTSPPTQVARRFVRALAEGVDRAGRSRSVARFEPGAGGGVFVAVGGDWSSPDASPPFLATFICAVEVFPAVAVAMGCVTPDRWRIDRAPIPS